MAGPFQVIIAHCAALTDKAIAEGMVEDAAAAQKAITEAEAQFKHVRVHGNATADELARRMQAEIDGIERL